MKTKIVLSLLCLALFSCQSSARKGEPMTIEKLKKELRSYLEPEKQLAADESAIIYVVDLLDHQEYKQGTLEDEKVRTVFTDEVKSVREALALFFL